MNIKKLIFEALDKSSRDISIEDGVFDITKQEHIEILRGNLLEVGMSVETVTDYLNFQPQNINKKQLQRELTLRKTQ